MSTTTQLQEGQKVKFKKSHSGRMRGTYVGPSSNKRYIDVILGSSGPIASILISNIK